MSCPYQSKDSELLLNSESKPLPTPSFWEQIKAAIQLFGKVKLEHILEKAFDQYGPILAVRSTVLMKGPEALKFLFTANPEIIQRAPIAEDGPPSLASLDGKIHTRHRQFVMQAFQKKRLLDYAERVKEYLPSLISEWNHEIEIGQEMKRLASRTILYSLLGLSYKSEQFQKFTQDYELVAHRGKKSSFFWTPYQKAMKAKPRLWNLLNSLVENRIVNPSDDAITAFIQAKEAFPDISRLDMLNYLYMLAEFGQEDLASILTSSRSILLSFPDIKQRLLQEWASFNPSSVTIEEIINVPFLENFLREIERLYPPVSFILRYTAKDFSFNGYKISKGCKILGSIFHTHRDPLIFKDPLKFDPSRYESEDNMSKAVLAFGGGYHMCPAKQYVYIQASVILFVMMKSSLLEFTQKETK